MSETAKDTDGAPVVGMTQAEYDAYYERQAQERPMRKILSQRHGYAVDWLETTLTSLDHLRRFVRHVEDMMETFRRETYTGPPPAPRREPGESLRAFMIRFTRSEHVDTPTP